MPCAGRGVCIPNPHGHEREEECFPWDSSTVYCVPWGCREFPSLSRMVRSSSWVSWSFPWVKPTTGRVVPCATAGNPIRLQGEPLNSLQGRFPPPHTAEPLLGTQFLCPSGGIPPLVQELKAAVVPSWCVVFWGALSWEQDLVVPKTIATSCSSIPPFPPCGLSAGASPHWESDLGLRPALRSLPTLNRSMLLLPNSMGTALPTS